MLLPSLLLLGVEVSSATGFFNVHGGPCCCWLPAVAGVSAFFCWCTAVAGNPNGGQPIVFVNLISNRLWP